MKCLYCGAEQPPNGEPQCSSCSFYLGEGQERAYKNQLAKIAAFFAEGQIDSETFVRCLGNMSLVLDKMHKSALTWESFVPEGSVPELVRNVFMKPINVMREGIEAFEEALKDYNLFAVDPDEEYLVKGAAAARKGHNLMVNSAQMASYAFREIKRQMPEGEAPSNEELLAMVQNSEPASV